MGIGKPIPGNQTRAANPGGTQETDVGFIGANAAGAPAVSGEPNNVARGRAGQKPTTGAETAAHNANVENAGPNKSDGQTSLAPDGVQGLSDFTHSVGTTIAVNSLCRFCLKSRGQIP
jgi:hypothetical protein